uniref:Uncharacterized protein n=1 Tax=Lepeophtheirus salmonis TaxID=72036 RepID=A0A0K2SVJ5_LEPSM
MICLDLKFLPSNKFGKISSSQLLPESDLHMKCGTIFLLSSVTSQYLKHVQTHLYSHDALPFCRIFPGSLFSKVHFEFS